MKLMYLFYPFIAAQKPESNGYLLKQLESLCFVASSPSACQKFFTWEKKKHSKISYESMEISNTYIDFHRLV